MTTGEDTHGCDYFTSLFLLPQLCNSTLSPSASIHFKSEQGPQGASEAALFKGPHHCGIPRGVLWLWCMTEENFPGCPRFYVMDKPCSSSASTSRNLLWHTKLSVLSPRKTSWTSISDT